MEQQKIEVGDHVKVVVAGFGMARDHSSFNKTEFYVEEVSDTGYFGKPGVKLQGYCYGYVSLECVELVWKNDGSWHPHHDLIVAWAKGAKIQCLDPFFNGWEDIETPTWRENLKYRIKPKDKKLTVDVVIEGVEDVEEALAKLKEALAKINIRVV